MIDNNSIVKEIHSSFTTAEKELLDEAQRRLENAADKDKKERAIKLARLGFEQSKPVRQMSREHLEEAESLLNLKCRYDKIAPQYKFLTEKKLKSICEKYGLVVGKADRYIGDIPDQNQEDIINFKILDETYLEVEDAGYRSAMFKTKDQGTVHPREMSTENLYDALIQLKQGIHRYRFVRTRSEIDDVKVSLIRAMITELALRQEKEMIDHVKESLERDTALSDYQIKNLMTPMKNSYFYVAADIDSFDTRGGVLEGNVLKEENSDEELAESIKDTLFRHYDPIVLAQVQGGYLIVTAWGDEAPDPNVVQPRRN